MSKAKMNKVQKLAGVKAAMLDRIPMAIQKKLTAELLAELCFVLYAEREEQFIKGQEAQKGAWKVKAKAMFAGFMIIAKRRITVSPRVPDLLPRLAVGVAAIRARLQ